MKAEDKTKKQQKFTTKPPTGFGGKFGSGKSERFNTKPFNPGSFKTQHRG